MFNGLLKALLDLKKGEPALVPCQGWTENFNRLVYPGETVIGDGFILFLDDGINNLLDLKIYIDSDEET